MLGAPGLAATGLGSGLLLVGLGLAPGLAHAHFVLVSPEAVYQQSALGDPQKAPPCGDNGTAVATGVITTFAPGETITVTIDETIFHPGHYRIALAVDEASLPEEPPVTPGATPCGSAPIDPAPAFPVLADGVFEHTEPFTEPQSIDITLPDDVTCDACVLQIIQFMSNHALNNPGGCYYHHCAAVALDGEPPAGTSGVGDSTGPSNGDGTTTADPAGTSNGGTGVGTASPGTTSVSDPTGPGVDTEIDQAGDESGGGCACASSRPDARGGGSALLLLLGLAGLRRRRVARRTTGR